MPATATIHIAKSLKSQPHEPKHPNPKKPNQLDGL